MPHSELRFLVTHLFADAEGRAAARRIDRLVGRLPGLEGLHLAEAAVDDLAWPEPSAVDAHLSPVPAPGEMRCEGEDRPEIENRQEKEQRHAC